MGGAGAGMLDRGLTPALAALVVATLAMAGSRGRPALRPALLCAAACAGWLVAAGSVVRIWSAHSLSDRLPLAALLLLAAGLVAQTWPRGARWAWAIGCLAAAAWLSGGAGAQRWRVLFGLLAAAWLLRRLGAGPAAAARSGAGPARPGAGAARGRGGRPRPRPGAASGPGDGAALAVALTGLWGALTSGGGGGEAASLAVVAAVGWAVGSAPPAMLTALTLGTLVAGSGTLLRGRLSLIDGACLAALVAAPLTRAIGRRLPGVAVRGAPVVASVAGLALGWVLMRVAR